MKSLKSTRRASVSERRKARAAEPKLMGKRIPKVGGCDAESVFAFKARQRGCTIVRGGWLDFIMIEKGGKPVFVEVKSRSDKLSDWQRKNFAALELAGVKVKVWWAMFPDKLMPWKKFDRLRKHEAASIRRARRQAMKERNPGMFSHSETERLERQRH